jgi:glycerol-3-phosphate dehydrogenase
MLHVFAGVGDTFGTCFGPLSRNRKFGYRLGRGETMEVKDIEWI